MSRTSLDQMILDLQKMDLSPSSPKSTKNKIPAFILKKYPRIPKGTLTETNEHITLIGLKKSNRKDFSKELAKNKLGVKVCSGLINADYLKNTPLTPGMNGFMLKNKSQIIGFMFFFREKGKNDNIFKIELVCSNKGRGKLKGLPLGRIMIDLVLDKAKKTKKPVKKIKLEAVKDAVNFYLSIGFKKIKGKAAAGLTLMSRPVRL